MSDAIDRWERRLHAYHDGELSRLARWRFERALRRSEALRAELASLRSLGDLVREVAAEPAAPELWERIAMRLPALDARRPPAPAGPAPAGGWLAYAAAATAGALVVALVFALAQGRFSERPTQVAEADAPGGSIAAPMPAAEPTALPVSLPAGGPSVRWMDSGDRNVMVIDDVPDATIVWVLDPPSGGVDSGRWP